MDELIIDCPIAPATAERLRSPHARRLLSTLARRVERRRHARPGGAAREWEFGIDLDGGERLAIRLPAMRDGGSITIVHHVPGASLHGGAILRVPGTVLPDSIMLAAEGRRLGDIVDLSGTSLSALADATVTDVFDVNHNGQAMLFHTDAPVVRPIRIHPVDLA